MELVKLANALDKRYFFEATIGCSAWNWDDDEEEDEQQEEPKTEEPKTEEPTQEDETMKRRYFYIPDIDSTMCVEISTKKEMIDLLDETIRFNCTDEECIFDIIYKDGSEIRIDEDNRKYKKSGIAAIVNDNGTTVQVFGAFEINENGVVYPALTEKIDENLIEVDDWNYHAPTEEEIDAIIAEEVEKEYFGEPAADQEPAENETDSAFIAEMFAALDYFKRVLWNYTEAEGGTRSERDISGDFWGAHECSVILSFVNVLLKSQGVEPHYKLKNDFDDLAECFEEIKQKFEYGDERTIEEIIAEYNFT
jgi:hypothetical protein